MSDKSREPEVRFHNPMPPGYVFVPKGNMYMTLNVRKRTHASGKTLYVVVDKNQKPIGLRCPSAIHDQVKDASETTKAAREKVVKSRDASVKDEFGAKLRCLFPKAPKPDVETILKRALKKRSGRVGRTGKLNLDEKVQLAVKAHIRHSHTDYDSHLRAKMPKARARQLTWPKVEQVATTWMSDKLKAAHQDNQVNKTKKRKPKASSSRDGPRKRVALGRPSSSSARLSSASNSGPEVIVISDDSEEEDPEEEEPFFYRDGLEDSDWEP